MRSIFFGKHNVLITSDTNDESAKDLFAFNKHHLGKHVAAKQPLTAEKIDMEKWRRYPQVS